VSVKDGLSYKFTIDGQNYSNTQDYAQGVSEKDKTDNKPIYKGKKQGEQITVYYNPENPKESYLHRQFVLGGFITIAFGQIFLALTFHLIEKWI